MNNCIECHLIMVNVTILLLINFLFIHCSKIQQDADVECNIQSETIKKAQCRRALSQFVNNTAYKKRLLGQLRPVSRSRQVCCLLS